MFRGWLVYWHLWRVRLKHYIRAGPCSGSSGGCPGATKKPGSLIGRNPPCSSRVWG